MTTAAALLLAAAGLGALALRRLPAVQILGLVAMAFAAGAIAVARQPATSVLATLARDVPLCRIEGRVLEHAGGLGTLVAVDLAGCDGYVPIEHAGVVFAEGLIGVAGAGLVGTVRLIPLGDDAFSDARRRLGGTATIELLRTRLAAPRSRLLALAARVRTGLQQATSGLPPIPAGLIRGLTIGDVRALDAHTVDTLRRAGLSHIVAVSGSNVAIVLGAVALLGARLSLRLRVAACAAMLCLYVAIVGPEPSVLRAAAMGAIALTGWLLGRSSEPLQALAIALIVLLFLRPALVYSVGLHLSVAATLGIVLWSAWLSRGLRRIPAAIALALATTLGAQAAVAPILVWVFGELSLTAPLANLLALPAVAPATILGFLAGAFGAIDASLGAPFARLAQPFASWILWVGRALGPPWAAIELPRWAGALLGAAAVAGVVAALGPAEPAGRVAVDE